MKKETSDMLDCELHMNNWPDLQLAVRQGTNEPSLVPLRDPRFFEKNNVAETVQFSGGWNSDVGLRIPMHLFLAPSLRSRTGQTRFKYNALTKVWDKQSKKCVIEEVVTYPVDYRNGTLTSPPSSDEILFQNWVKKRTSTDSGWTFGRKRIKTTGVISEAADSHYPSGLDDLESNYSISTAPYLLNNG